MLKGLCVVTRAERVKRLSLDFGCIVTGLGVIIHQTVVMPPGQASEALLVAAVSVLGIPAGVGLLSLRSSGATGTTLPPLPSPGSGSPPPSSSPSPAPSGAGDSS
ncbi:hypothetical protein [Micromonospora sp. WMMD710]|uniref:hypothetical protein n=1 Tax=Micromonospora sp. WMMD710 TaxID=3016085 RepID=UPI002417B594|nr:hypothetical protein [Micromonospora sp. WMMD710]MDG4758147.1 hypothetical protein [Micromonospora sp. WMMD710]